MTLKKHWKLFIKNTYFRLAHKIAIWQLKKKMKTNDFKISKKKKSKKIIFNLVYGMYGQLMFWEGGLAKALQLRGHDVKALICGNALTMCTTEYSIQSVHNNTTCKHCVDYSTDFLKNIQMPYSDYYHYISEEEIQKIKNKVKKMTLKECKTLKYKDVEAGSLSINSVLRYFKGSLNPDKAIYDKILREELTNAIITIDIAEKVLEIEKPDVLVTRHMGYSSWGSFADYLEKKGVRVCYIGSGYGKNNVTFDIVRLENFFKRYYEKFRNEKPLNKEEENELQSFINERITAKDGDTALYRYSDEKVALEDQFNFNNYEKTFVVFPNLPWDVSLLSANQVFDGVYDWISYTLNEFKKKPNQLLIVKIHPAEFSVWNSEDTVLDYIKNNFPELPDNIKIIPPNTKISPYDLFKFIDVGIVYNGTIGLEMVLENIPVVVAGSTHYGGKGFTKDITSKKEYVDTLFNKQPILSKQSKEIARIYAYFYFIKSFVPYHPAIKNKYTKIYQWKDEFFDNLNEGKNPQLDHICNYITEGVVFQDW